MNPALPEGTSLGSTEAPLPWIFSHTVRFLGKVDVSVKDGDGFILIRRGEAVAFCFRSAGMTLRGNAAREYLGSQEAVTFTLRKYTGDEFAAAILWCRENGVHVHDAPLERSPGISPSPPVQEVKPARADPQSLDPISALSGEAGVLMVGRCAGDDLTISSGSRPAGLSCRAVIDAVGAAETLAAPESVGGFILETSGGILLAVPGKDSTLCILFEGAVPLGRIRTTLQNLRTEQ
ncbi:hypothetical protein [Methanofollis fontis]|uniref:Uncharacterized protein n=1 Tax=Methanofollis fontis TaxID=2052832 RepID=A0A483CNC5_9EURY|nr:hypothetical protein [Methanofollis fontis]TAJ44122.1 hypothetical protein CUJ86_08820 [Methanofollis fontis]